LFGGAGDDRRRSVAAARDVVRALDAPLCWFWSANGFVYDVSRHELLAHEQPLERDFVPSRPAIWPDLEMALDTLPVDEPEFVLVMLGEDVMRLLSDRNLPCRSAP